VAGVAGAVPGATVAAATEAKVEEEEEMDIPQKRYNILDLRRIWKIAPKLMMTGGSIAKTIFGIANVLLYIVLLIPPIIAIPIAVTLLSWNKDRKARLEEEAREWEEYQAEHGYEEGYQYDEYGQPVPAYPPADDGYYEGDEYYDDRYGY
jgi:hypothetical protein